MNEQLSTDLLQMESLFELVKTQGLDYIKNLKTRPTSSTAVAASDGQLLNQGIGTLAALQTFNEKFEPMMVASSGPRYWGFVTGGSTPASIVGDWLTSIYDQNTQSVNGQGDISANLEVETIRLLLDLFNLPKEFIGGFVTGATMSNFTCLAVARQWVGKELGQDIAKDGMTQPMHVLTATPHSSTVKSLALLGMGSNNIIKIKTMEGNREAVDIVDLENEIIKLQGAPFIFISSAGTVNTVDFDDFESIAKLKEKYNFWLHIDAAFGGFANCTTSYQHLLNGWEVADSITVDCHKWLNVPYESAVFFVQEKHQNLQIESFQNSNAPYLGDPKENFNYLNFLPENSRRLKALPVWFSLMAYGKKGIQDIVENNIEHAQYLGRFIEQNNEFKLLAPVRLNTVCFTLNQSEHSADVTDFLQRVNATGKVFMTPTMLNGQKGIRAAFVNWMTTNEDIDIAIKTMLEVLTEMKK
jgi:glutamate/tyrosine decarboxylase-like PLP-dependent enzyme